MVTDKVRLGATMSAAVVRQGLPEVRFEEGLKEVWRGGGHRSMEVGRGRNPGTQWRPVRLGCAKMWVLERSTGARESCPGVDLWEGAHPQPYRRSWKRNEASYQLSLPKEALKPFPEWRELGHWPTFNKTAVWCHPQFFSFWEDCFFISKKNQKKGKVIFFLLPFEDYKRLLSLPHPNPNTSLARSARCIFPREVVPLTQPFFSSATLWEWSICKTVVCSSGYSW